jgi:hypothetical protein
MRPQRSEPVRIPFTHEINPFPGGGWPATRHPLCNHKRSRPHAATNASPALPPANAEVGPGCPLGTHAYTPDSASAAQHGASALLPAALAQSNPSLATDPALTRIATMNTTWLTSLECTIVPAHSTLPVNPSSTEGAANSSSAGPNWSGYTIGGIDPGFAGYDVASMEWNVPAALYPSPEEPVWNSIWPGIGSGSEPGDTLIQAGSVSNAGPGFLPPFTDYSGIEAWYELFPQENMVVIDSLHPKPGDHFVTTIVYDMLENVGYFYVCDAGTCASISQELYGGSLAHQVEYIAERPTLNGQYTELGPLGSSNTLDVTNAAGSRMENSFRVSDAFTAGSASGPDPARYDNDSMNGCDGTPLASPTSMTPSGAFQVNWYALGRPEMC